MSTNRSPMMGGGVEDNHERRCQASAFDNSTPAQRWLLLVGTFWFGFLFPRSTALGTIFSAFVMHVDDMSRRRHMLPTRT